jgi:hypothetical protein
MVQKFIPRFKTWKEILLWPAVEVLAVFGFLHLLDWLLEIFLPVLRERVGIKMIMSLLSWQSWTILGLAILLLLTLESAYRLLKKKEEDFSVNYIAIEERALNAEEKLTTKIILSLVDCIVKDDNLHMKLSVCNDGYKSWTIEFFNIITADKKHLLEIKTTNGSLENAYNSILNTNCIMGISKKSPPLQTIAYKPDDIDEITIKEPFNLLKYLKENEIEGIKRLPLGIILGVRDYKGLQHLVYYYPCCEITLLTEEKVGCNIIHKPFEKILKEGETNVVQSWRIVC